MNPHHRQTEKIWQSCRLKLYLKPFLIPLFNFAHKRPTFAFTDESEYTLAFANRIAHKGLHTESRVFQMGVVSLPSDRSARFGNPAWPGGRTANFAAFEPWPEALSKNAERLRDSDVLMHVAVPRRRGPAGLRDPVVRPLMLRFFVSVRKASALSPANATLSPSPPKTEYTPGSAQRIAHKRLHAETCVPLIWRFWRSHAILMVTGSRSKIFFNFFENCVRNGAARASI